VLNPVYRSADGVLFSKDQTTLKQFPFGKAGSYAIPGTVTSIADEAFGMDDIGFAIFNFPPACPGLTNLFIPASLTNISDYAFSHCGNLTGVTLANGISSIGYESFAECFQLTSLTIPSSVISIGDLAFYYSGLTNVTVPSTVTSLGSGAFAVCGNLTGVTMENGIASIGAGTFNWCTNLTDITIPVSVTTIGDRAFYDCTSLTNLTILDGVTDIGSEAFSGCYRLAAAELGNRVANIGDSAFFACPSLASITIPGSLANIGNGAFGYCSGLTTVTIPSSVTSIGIGAFGQCNNVTNFTVDTANAFYGSADGVLFNKDLTKLIQFPGGKALASYAVPSGVTDIENSAFHWCLKLASITIPASVTHIEYGAISACLNLTNVAVAADNSAYSSSGGVLFDKNLTTLLRYPSSKANGFNFIPGTVTSIGDNAFDYCGSLTNLVIPNGVTNIGAGAFENCDNLTTVTMGKGMTRSNFVQGGDGFKAFIGYRAFAACVNLTGVFFQENSPITLGSTFDGDSFAKSYYLPGTRGWSSTYDSCPAVLWNPVAQTGDGSFGVRTNQFGFTITGTADIPIVVEGCTNLASAIWTPLQTCSVTNGLIYFSDSDWAKHSTCSYRIRSP